MEWYQSAPVPDTDVERKRHRDLLDVARRGLASCRYKYIKWAIDKIASDTKKRLAKAQDAPRVGTLVKNLEAISDSSKKLATELRDPYLQDFLGDMIPSLSDNALPPRSPRINKRAYGFNTEGRAR